MIIQNNMLLMNVSQNLGKVDKRIYKSRDRLVSGNKIRTMSDDAAGLIISEKLRTQIRGLDVVTENVQSAVSLIQTTDKALNDIHNIIQDMRELAVQAANDTNSIEDRKNIQDEINALTEEINKVSLYTEYNNIKLLKGSEGNELSLSLQIGANTSQQICLNINKMNSQNLNLSSTVPNQTLVTEEGITVYSDNANQIIFEKQIEYPIDVSTYENANSAISTLDKALAKVTLERTMLGSYYNRLGHSIRFSDITIENLEEENSFIMGVEMDKEIVNLTKDNILQEVAQSIFAQANQSTQSVLSLLK